MKERMKKLIVIGSAFLLTFTALSSPIVRAKDISYDEYAEEKTAQIEKEIENMTDEELNQKIEESAQAFDDLMKSGVVQIDGCGKVSYVNVDKLEEKFGVTPESQELRRLMKEKTPNEGSSSCQIMTRGHVENFSKCFLKQLLKDFGLWNIRSAIHNGVIKLIGEKQYFKAVQKVAQIAVNKLGKKAAAKIVAAATPAGWALHAWKAGLWSYRCTVEYDKYA